MSALALMDAFGGARPAACSVNSTFDKLFVPADEICRAARCKDRLMLARLGSR